ncbi:MAG: hypothetical protein KDA17_05330 [Candidatus Saccharibacteria bacterium]|nr:hypothetical protein [Candidatus Saccharibacteria bacterium]
MQRIQPLIAEPVLVELLAWAKPADMTRDCNTFDMGYEQAKRDLLRKIEVIINASVDTGDSYDFIDAHKRRIGQSAFAKQTGRL